MIYTSIDTLCKWWSSFISMEDIFLVKLWYHGNIVYPSSHAFLKISFEHRCICCTRYYKMCENRMLWNSMYYHSFQPNSSKLYPMYPLHKSIYVCIDECKLHISTAMKCHYCNDRIPKHSNMIQEINLILETHRIRRYTQLYHILYMSLSNDYYFEPRLIYHILKKIRI